jgi:FXSXX-COOH protein
MSTQFGDLRPIEIPRRPAAPPAPGPLSAVAARGEAALRASLRRVLPVAGTSRTTVSRFNSSI